MPKMYTQLLFILTVMAMMTPVEFTFSALNRIKSYTKSTQGHEKLTELAFMSTEKELLQKLRHINSKHKFTDKISVKIFLQMRRMNFILN